MKRTTATRLLACLLSALLLLPMGLSAAAENGPNPNPVFEDICVTYLMLVELDDNGEYAQNEPGESNDIRLFGDNTVFPNEKASYDLKTNTLTLTDFNNGNYLLEANMMGDDFTLCVKGDNRLAGIMVWGDGWGGSLHITGDGTLTVNEKKTMEYGVRFIPEGADSVAFAVDPSAKLHVYGQTSAIQVYGADTPFSMTIGGVEQQIRKENAIRQNFVYIDGYSNPREEEICLCKNAADPNGLYGISVWYNEEDHTTPVNVTVERFIYLDAYGRYVTDYDWAQDRGGDYVLSFSTEESAATAGFTPLLDAHGQKQWRTIDVFANYGMEAVKVDFKGDEYVTIDEFDEAGNLREVVMNMEPIDEIPGKYVFTPAAGVNPANLLDKIETVRLDDVFDYTFPDTAFDLEIDMHVLLGDVNGDGDVTAEDARYALRAAVGMDDTAEGLDFSDPAYRCCIAADVDGDPGITAADARLILRAAVGLEDLNA